MKIVKFIINVAVAPILLLLCGTIAFLMVKSKKEPPVVPEQEVVITVSVSQAEPQTVTPTIQSFGNTQSYFNTLISSQVAGEIIEVSPRFEVGSFVEKGEWLAKINPADFQANLSSRKAAYATAQTALAEEETRGILAKEDWLAAGRPLAEATDLTLRIPQLNAAKATAASAKAAVEQAELDLERTTIRAPFTAMIESRTASPGNVVSRGASLGSLIASDKIQVRLPLTPSQAARLQLPSHHTEGDPLTAIVTTPTIPGAKWQATINRVEPIIDPKNQSLFLVGEIESPFADPNAFLPVGAFVNVAIEASPMRDVYDFPEAAVVEDAFVWVVSPENVLAKQPLEIAFSQDGKIFARIAKPRFPLPLTVLDLPLASLREGQRVIAEQSDKNS